MSSRVGETIKSSPSNKFSNSQNANVALRSEDPWKSFLLKGYCDEAVTDTWETGLLGKRIAPIIA